MGYQPVVTMVNFEENHDAEDSGIATAAVLMNQSVVKPGERKFTKDAEGYTEPRTTIEMQTNSAAQHIPTPIVSNLTSHGDIHMNSRESTQNEYSATLPIMNHESDEDWSSQCSSNRDAIL